MSDLICSFMIPSRKRPEKLDACLQSIHDTATTRDFECLVRLDDDDTESQRAVTKWTSATVRFIRGPRHPYGQLENTQHPLAQMSRGRWLWVFNDDFELQVEARSWDELLRQVPITGYYCQPEFHKLNSSTYHKDRRSCGPVLPNGSWDKVGRKLGSQCDYDLPDALDRIGWRPWFLPGVTIFHNRNQPEKIIQEHAI